MELDEQEDQEELIKKTQLMSRFINPSLICSKSYFL